MHKKNLGAADRAQKGVSEEGESMCSFLDVWESDNRFGSKLSSGQWEEGNLTSPWILRPRRGKQTCCLEKARLFQILRP